MENGVENTDKNANKAEESLDAPEVDKSAAAETELLQTTGLTNLNGSLADEQEIVDEVDRQIRSAMAAEQEQPEGQSIVGTLLSYAEAFIGNFIAKDDEGQFLSNYDIDLIATFQEDPGALATIVAFETGDEITKERLAKWEELMVDENHFQWERRCKALIPKDVLQSELMRSIETFRGKLKAYFGRWSTDKKLCSPNIHLLEDELTAHKVPILNVTDAIRGRLGVDRGIHAWDIRFTGPIGSHCSIGVATADSQLLSKSGYVSLVGDDEFSWGWDIVFGNVCHNGNVVGKYPKDQIYTYTPGDIIRMILHCDTGELSFEVNEMSFGVALRNIQVRTLNNLLYPSVGILYGNLETSLVYLGLPPVKKSL